MTLPIQPRPPRNPPQKTASRGFAFVGFGAPVRGLMAFHKFKIGQRVSYRPSRDTFPTWYVVTALLPAMNGEFKYQIRRQDGSADLVVNEGDLRENRER
jgi:hypothetical protein